MLVKMPGKGPQHRMRAALSVQRPSQVRVQALDGHAHGPDPKCTSSANHLLGRVQNETAGGNKMRLSLAPISGQAQRAENRRFFIAIQG